jgi:hypothetical protein
VAASAATSIATISNELSSVVFVWSLNLRIADHHPTRGKDDAT